MTYNPTFGRQVKEYQKLRQLDTIKKERKKARRKEGRKEEDEEKLWMIFVFPFYSKITNCFYR